MQKNNIIESLKSGNVIELNLPKKVIHVRRENIDESYSIPSKNSKLIFLGEKVLGYEQLFLKFLYDKTIIYLFKPWCEEHFSTKTIKIIK